MKSVLINGPGANALTVARSSDASTPAFSILTVNANVTATIVGLTLSGGMAADGGGIDNLGFLTLRDSRVTGKLAAFSGVREFPMRVKCATLAWHTLKAALDGPEGKR